MHNINTDKKEINAHVIAVFPEKVVIAVESLDIFKSAEDNLRVGSYIKIYDNENAKLIAIIENFQIQTTEKGNQHIIEAFPLGIMRDDKFERGGDSLAIPPKEAHPASISEIKVIYENSIKEDAKFFFSTLAHRKDIAIPVDGNKFFNKHIAIVGSTGSGKSHTVAKIIQSAVKEKPEGFSLNNSHVIIFDIHSEYRNAFPDASYIDVSNLRLPYWLLNSEELEEFFIDTESNDHNQRSIFKEGVITDKKNNASSFDKDKIHLDTPIKFDIKNVLTYAKEKNSEQIDSGETYR
jgi:uncharacterized protein